MPVIVNGVIQKPFKEYEQNILDNKCRLEVGMRERISVVFRNEHNLYAMRALILQQR